MLLILGRRSGLLTATFAARAARLATFLESLELSPAADAFCIQAVSGMADKGLIMLHEMKADAIDPVSSVDGGFDLGFAPVKGIEKSEGEGSIVLGDAVAHHIKRIAEGRITVFGKMTDTFRAVTGAILKGVKPGKSPHLTGVQEARHTAETGEVAGSIIDAQAGDGR